MRWIQRSRVLRPLRAAVVACALCVGGAVAEESVVTDSSIGRETGLPIPRFVALKANEVNLRAGPGRRYPVEWIYQRRGLPVEVTAEFDAWRRVRDHTGTSGWVHHSMITGRRTVLVIGELRTLFSDADVGSRPLARLEPGALGSLSRCEAAWCAVEFSGIDGWLRRGEVFGLYADEEIR